MTQTLDLPLLPEPFLYLGSSVYLVCYGPGVRDPDVRKLYFALLLHLPLCSEQTIWLISDYATPGRMDDLACEEKRKFFRIPQNSNKYLWEPLKTEVPAEILSSSIRSCLESCQEETELYRSLYSKMSQVDQAMHGFSFLIDLGVYLRPTHFRIFEAHSRLAHVLLGRPTLELKNFEEDAKSRKGKRQRKSPPSGSGDIAELPSPLGHRLSRESHLRLTVYTEADRVYGAMSSGRMVVPSRILMAAHDVLVNLRNELIPGELPDYVAQLESFHELLCEFSPGHCCEATGNRLPAENRPR